jgi:hypothetical protein
MTAELLERLNKLFRMLGGKDGEILAAAKAMSLLLEKEHLSLADFTLVRVDLVTSKPIVVDGAKWTDEQMLKAMQRGRDEGAAEEAERWQAPPEFWESDGTPRWYEIAKFCADNKDKLRDDFERRFIPSVMAQFVTKPPSPKQIKSLMPIFVRLGGFYDPKTCNVSW